MSENSLYQSAEEEAKKRNILYHLGEDYWDANSILSEWLEQYEEWKKTYIPSRYEVM